MTVTMLAKLLRWIDYLSMSPVDKLIAILGEDTVSIWNGVNYSHEYKLAPDGMQYYSCVPEEYELIRIGIGKYYSGYGDFVGGDYESCSVFELTIDRFQQIRRIERNHAYYNGKPLPQRIEKKVDKLVKKIQLVSTLSTRRPRLEHWVDTIFNIEACIRYSTAYSVENILTKNWDRVNKMREQIDWLSKGISYERH